MSRSEPDATRIVRLWLEEGVTALPDHVLDAVLDQLPATSQRRPTWLARRTPTMNKFVTIGLAAAAVVVAAFLGYRLLVEPNVGGQPPAPPPSSSATPEPTPQSTPDSTPRSFDSHPGGVLLPGAYVLTGVEPYQITFTMPGGWEKLAVPNLVWSQDDDKSTVGFGTIDDLVSDPCDPSQGYVGVGPTADDLATALADVPGVAINSSEEITISGFSGTMVDIEWSEANCPAEVEPMLWVKQPGDVLEPHPGGSDTLFDRMYFLDVNGERLVISTSAHANATDQRVADIQSILDSIQIE
jgi:hypothetical protein